VFTEQKAKQHTLSKWVILVGTDTWTECRKALTRWVPCLIIDQVQLPSEGDDLLVCAVLHVVVQQID